MINTFILSFSFYIKYGERSERRVRYRFHAYRDFRRPATAGKAAESGKPHVRKRIHYFTPQTDKLTDIRKKYCRIDNRREKNMTGEEQETPAAMPQPDTGETAVGKYGIAKEDGQI